VADSLTTRGGPSGQQETCCFVPSKALATSYSSKPMAVFLVLTEEPSTTTFAAIMAQRFATTSQHLSPRVLARTNFRRQRGVCGLNAAMRNSGRPTSERERLSLFVNVIVPRRHQKRQMTRTERRHYRKTLPARRRDPTWIFPQQRIVSSDFRAEVETRRPTLCFVSALNCEVTRTLRFKHRN
jgi:hypothetical protein